MDSFNLTTAELQRIIILAVILLVGLGVLKWALKLTARLVTLGCLGILIVLVVMAVAGKVM